MTGLRLALFDIDGTLVDSQRVIVRAAEAGFAAIGQAPPARRDILAAVGLRLPEALAVMAERAGAAPDAADQARLEEAYREAYGAAAAEGVAAQPLFDGAVACLDALEDQGWLLGAVTGKARRGAEKVLTLHELWSRFLVLRSADDGPGKPDPAGTLEAMAALGAEPGETVVIGDTSYDMQMARSAGAAALGVAWGYHEPAALEAAGAQAIARDFAEVPRLMARMVEG